ncbi:MAG: hypothetical protein ABIX01_01965 [Chitinophagaceae bacterium]
MNVINKHKLQVWFQAAAEDGTNSEHIKMPNSKNTCDEQFYFTRLFTKRYTDNYTARAIPNYKTIPILLANNVVFLQLQVKNQQ